MRVAAVLVAIGLFLVLAGIFAGTKVVHGGCQTLDCNLGATPFFTGLAVMAVGVIYGVWRRARSA